MSPDKKLLSISMKVSTLYWLATCCSNNDFSTRMLRFCRPILGIEVHDSFHNGASVRLLVST